MGSLSKAEFLERGKPRMEAVECPRLGGTVYVREMSNRERTDLELEINASDGRSRMRSAMLVRTLCDESGTLLFAPSDEAEFAQIGAGVVEPLFTVALRLNGFSSEDRNALENAGKN